MSKAAYTKIETNVSPTSATTASGRRRLSTTRISRADHVSNIESQTSATTTNIPVRRRSSAIAIPPSRFTHEELPSLTTSTKLFVDEISATEQAIHKRDGLLVDDDDIDSSSIQLRRSFTTSRPVTLGDYCHVLYIYPNYRAYLLSHICQNTGDWFVRIASLLIVEELADVGEKGKSLSHMTLARLLPNAIFAQVGGILADSYDRRNLMIIIDMLSALVVLGYLMAISYSSLPIFYIITSLRSALSASYYPITTGIVPLMICEPRDLQLAVTMNSWAWGTTSIIGGMIAGSLAAAIGLRTCYFVDFATFLLSALIVAIGVKGNFKVKSGTVVMNTREQQPPGSSTTELEEDNPTYQLHQIQNKNPIRNLYIVVRDLVVYLFTCGFGMMVFLKSSASFVWGIEDIVGAEFSTVFREDGTENEELSSFRMGMLFSVIGAGCMTGPALVNLVTDANRPYTLQRACWIGLLFLTCGWLAISLVKTFPEFLAGSFFRTMGSGTVWVNATLVLQTMADKEILGRALAVEYTLATLFEAASAAVTGQLDEAGFSKNMLALFGASLGVIMLTFWGLYYSMSLGAAHPSFNNNYQFDMNKVIEDRKVEDEEGGGEIEMKGSIA